MSSTDPGYQQAGGALRMLAEQLGSSEVCDRLAEWAAESPEAAKLWRFVIESLEVILEEAEERK